jgi:hypothetical protein
MFPKFSLSSEINEREGRLSSFIIVLISEDILDVKYVTASTCFNVNFVVDR